jgi:hypothetical protein
MDRLPQGYNVHHTLFTRRVHDSQIHSRKWRRHHGMIIPMNMRSHIELHNTVSPLPLPSKDLARCALDHLDTLPLGTPRVESFDSVRQRMWELSRARSLGEEALHFAKNFDLQAAFFDDTLEAEEGAA